ncbi:MAG: DUF1553 domain-containing protein, partial [Planctomycetales bacterium]|nr:DUF1553 domain-containing protein [Planctomycetales bacterium]
DKPYDRFVFEQLAGDAVGEDRATGFLVAAAALLPGQIGQDDASKRQARQDELDEIIVGTGATFLGVTIGCARCHDHKFDPFTQQDYYSMQAFFAGVEYGDREIHDADYELRRQRATELGRRIAQLDAKLREYAPPAFPGDTLIIDDDDPRTTALKPPGERLENPSGSERGYRDDVGADDRLGNLSRGGFTRYGATPSEDVFTWNPGVTGRYHLWVSWGAHGDATQSGDARYLLDADGRLDTRDDQTEVARANQQHFSGVSEGPMEKKPLWSGLLDAGTHDWAPETRLVLRCGGGAANVAADVIVLQADDAAAPADEKTLPRLRGPVDAAGNDEYFAPVDARFIRFTVAATIDDNLHEPCLDELEVFAVGSEPRNVALAATGTIATSSGNYSETGRHQLGHINDGRFGNEWSWISSERGGGWVQLELPRVERIDRIRWARDRERQYADRLPIDYRIEVSLDGVQWTTVASSGDRVPPGTPHDDVYALLRNQPAGGTVELMPLIDERKDLDARRDELETTRLVFAGVFREPHETFVLNRGDPEQRLDPTVPHVPVSLGSLTLGTDVTDQQRRTALADWIASPENPLTARVIVNRVWQQHFGHGLVDTPSDFGMNGARPTHPQLLDWLAQQFVADGWSMKRLHRRILLSQTFCQSNQVDSQATVVDADNRLLGHFASRRLEAEAIRDCMLFVSGRLNLEMGGPGFDFFETRGGLSGFPPKQSFGPDELRRMIYAHKIRMEPVPVFGAFDCPDAGQATPSRSQSTTAIQALNLFNSDFVVEQATELARRAEAESSDTTSGAPDDATAIDRAFRLTLSRRPSEQERAAAARVVAEHGLPTLCRVLLNTNEFLFIP